MITSAFNLAGKNVLYSIVALAFMIPAEKLLRSMFGFEKAKTPPSLMGASMMSSMATNAMNRLKGVGSHNKRKDDKEGVEGQKGIKTPKNLGGDVNPTEAIAGDSGTNEAVEEESGYNDSDGIRETPSEELDGIRETPSEELDAGEEDSDSMWATPEIQETMDQLDSREQALANMSPSLLSKPEYFEASQRERERIQKERRKALLENYRANRIRMANQNNTGEQNASGNVQLQSGGSARFTSPRNAAIDRARQQNRIANNQRKPDTNWDRFRRVVRYGKKPAIIGAKTLGKTALKLPLAATLATLGGVATLASTGDIGKTMQAMTTGVDAGLSLGAGVWGLGENAVDGTGELIDFAQGARDAWRGDDPEYEKKQQEKQVKKIMKDAEVKNMISKRIGEKELKRIEENGDFEKYVQNGFTDGNDIADLVELQERAGIGTEAAIGVGKLHRDMAGGKDTTMMNKRKMIEAIQDRYLSGNTDGNEEKAQKLSEKTIEYMDKLSNIKYNH